MTAEQTVNITHLRECLGVAYQHVARNNEPIVVHRYRRPEVILVPLWEWRFLKRLEAAVQAGRIDVTDILAEIEK